ncbi:H-NS family nucleoid-associated regulatory protein [Cupriavidus basilensis]|uniref:H-NS family nucleoid-associated regulatory protein n=1 Tax=Cupriavidus basilensis TaxID=68895 RepID=UPI0032047225
MIGPLQRANHGSHFQAHGLEVAGRLTLADLQAAGCFNEPPSAPSPGAVCYRNAQGQGWDGRGPMPDWLQRAVHAGQTVEHFRVPIAGVMERAARGGADLKSNGQPEVRRIFDESRPSLEEAQALMPSASCEPQILKSSSQIEAYMAKYGS